MRIYADYREERSGVPKLLRDLGVVVILENLSVGDYVVGEGILVERKSVSDFVKSIFDKRLFDQVSRLKESSSRAFLIIEGDLERVKRYVENWNAVLGALVAIQVSFDINVLTSTDVKDTAYLIYKLAEKFEESQKRSISLVNKPKISSIKEAQEFVVQAFPNVGPVLAKKLLERFGSIRAICDADLVELQRVLGEKRGEDLYRLMNSKYADSSSNERKAQKITDVKQGERADIRSPESKSKKSTLEDFMS
jgi:DNA excision repair protein ERCC-4